MRSEDEGGAPFWVSAVLDAEGRVGIASIGSSIFSRCSSKDFLDVVGNLVWTQHGGSGYSLTWGDAQDLLWTELEYLIELQNERRRAEAEAIRESSRSK